MNSRDTRRCHVVVHLHGTRRVSRATTVSGRVIGRKEPNGTYPLSPKQQILELLRSAARYTIAAAQDANAMIRMLHANYGAGFLFALESIFTHEEIRRETGLDMREIHHLIVVEQDKAQRILAEQCPSLVPQGKLAQLGREAFVDPGGAVVGLPRWSTSQG